MNYDIIGDIHGHATELKALLQKLGYQTDSQGVFAQQGRQVIFTGDFIDRGHQNIEVLNIVMSMVEQGQALAVMGNHEYNAICFHTMHPETGLPLREHSAKNVKQHQAFLAEFAGKDALLVKVINWFRSLPLFLDLDGFRVVHAEWEPEAIQRLNNMNWSDVCFFPDEDFILNSSIQGSEENSIIETLLKGSELKLPEGFWFTDKDGQIREDIRIRWWANSGSTYRDIAMINTDQIEKIPALPIPDSYINSYSPTEKPVFFGHYWMKPPVALVSRNAACLDFSVARGGVLCGYRWDGDSDLKGSNFKW